MKSLTVLLAGALIVGPAPALERDGRTITLDDGEMEMCSNGGACIVVTVEAIEYALKRARMAALLSCKGAT